MTTLTAPPGCCPTCHGQLNPDGECPFPDLHERLLEHLASLEVAGVVNPCPACFGACPDGACRRCAWDRARSADPAYHICAVAHDRQELLDAEEYPIAQRRIDTAIIHAYGRAELRAERDSRTAPNGCGICGIEEYGHGMRYGPRHIGAMPGWVPPTDRQRLDRMRARRAARNGRLYEQVAVLFFRTHAELSGASR